MTPRPPLAILGSANQPSQRVTNMEEDKIIAAILAAGIVVARSNSENLSPFGKMLRTPQGAVEAYRDCLNALRQPPAAGRPTE